MSTIWIICQYAMTPQNGGYLRQHFLARELGKSGHDVYVIAARVNHMMTHPENTLEAPFQEVMDGYTMVRLNTISYPHAHHKRRILGWIQFGWQLPNLMRRGLPKPDAVLYSSPNLLSFIGAERIARKVNARLVFEVRDIWPLTLHHVGNISPRHPFMRLMQWVEDRAYRVSDAVISTLPNADEHMISRGMDPSKFHWIPNGADFSDDNLQDPLDPSVVAQLPQRRFLVGYVGTHGEANYLHPILDAAGLLKERDDIGFVMVGGGRSKRALQERAQKELLNNVTFIDPIPKPQVQGMLAWFDVCILNMLPLPLYRFGVSLNKLIDYFVAAKPVIYAAATGKYNPVVSSNSGIAVEPGNSKQMAAAIVQLVELTKEERLKIGQNGRKVVENDYDYKKLGQKLDHILTSSSAK